MLIKEFMEIMAQLIFFNRKFSNYINYLQGEFDLTIGF